MDRSIQSAGRRQRWEAMTCTSAKLTEPPGGVSKVWGFRAGYRTGPHTQIFFHRCRYSARSRTAALNAPIATRVVARTWQRDSGPAGRSGYRARAFIFRSFGVDADTGGRNLRAGSERGPGLAQKNCRDIQGGGGSVGPS